MQFASVLHLVPQSALSSSSLPLSSLAWLQRRALGGETIRPRWNDRRRRARNQAIRAPFRERQLAGEHDRRKNAHAVVRKVVAAGIVGAVSSTSLRGGGRPTACARAVCIFQRDPRGSGAHDGAIYRNFLHSPRAHASYHNTQGTRRIAEPKLRLYTQQRVAHAHRDRPWRAHHHHRTTYIPYCNQQKH